MEEKVHKAHYGIKIQGEFITTDIQEFQKRFTEFLKTDIQFKGNMQGLEFHEYVEIIE